MQKVVDYWNRIVAIDLQMQTTNVQIIQKQNEVVAEAAGATWEYVLQACERNQHQSIMEDNLMASFWCSDSSREVLKSVQIGGWVSVIFTAVGFITNPAVSIPTALGSLGLSYLSGVAQGYIGGLLQEIVEKLIESNCFNADIVPK